MAKKSSGLGRGLGELLADNTPEIQKSSAKVTIRTEKKDISMTAELYESKPKNKSVKANYR